MKDAATMTMRMQDLWEDWEHIQEEYSIALKAIKEANDELEEVRKRKDKLLLNILFGID